MKKCDVVGVLVKMGGWEVAVGYYCVGVWCRGASALVLLFGMRFWCCAHVVRGISWRATRWCHWNVCCRAVWYVKVEKCAICGLFGDFSTIARTCTSRPSTPVGVQTCFGMPQHMAPSQREKVVASAHARRKCGVCRAPVSTLRKVHIFTFLLEYSTFSRSVNAQHGLIGC